MPPTLVHITVGTLIGVALLGAAYDRRSLGVVVVAAAIPDLDAALSLAIPGATNAVLHSVFIPLGLATFLYWDTRRRPRSWLRERAGWYGVRVAWVAIAAYAVAGIGLDLFNVDSVALLYPVSSRFWAIVGQFYLSTQQGVIQTYIEIADGAIRIASPGTMATYHVETWLNPTPGTGNPAGVERRLRLVESSWQLVMVVTGLAAAPVKWYVERGEH